MVDVAGYVHAGGSVSVKGGGRAQDRSAIASGLPDDGGYPHAHSKVGNDGGSSTLTARGSCVGPGVEHGVTCSPRLEGMEREGLAKAEVLYKPVGSSSDVRCLIDRLDWCWPREGKGPPCLDY